MELLRIPIFKVVGELIHSSKLVPLNLAQITSIITATTTPGTHSVKF